MRDSVILTEDRLREEVEYFLRQDAFVFDVETMPTTEGAEDRGVPKYNDVVWIALATHGRTIVIPMGHPNGDRMIRKATRRKNKETGKFDPIPVIYDSPPKQLKPSTVFSALRPLFFSEEIVKVAHNATFDIGSIAKYYDEEVCPGPHEDSIMIQHLINENLMTKNLKYLTEKYYQVKYDFENVGKCIEKHSFSKVAHYAYMDAKYTWLLWMMLRPKIDWVDAQGHNLEKVNFLETDLLPVLVDMNLEGAPVDEPALKELEQELSEMESEILTKTYRTAGKVFNMNAAGQKAALLFSPKAEGGQGLKPKVLTKGGKKKDKAGQELKYADYSTAHDILEDLYGTNPLVKHMLEYAEVHKLLSTYVQGYLGVEGDPDRPCRIYNGRIHADMVSYGTVTGRFSCLSGATRIVTNRGEFSMEEYQPSPGDLVRTHRNRWKPVVRKYDQGVRDVYRVTLSNGFSIECTLDHLIYTAKGWFHAGSLSPGDKVLVDDRFENSHPERGHGSTSAGHISLRGQADDAGDGTLVRMFVSDCEPYPLSSHGRRGTSAREGTSLLSFEGGQPEPDAREVRVLPPQLSGRDQDRAGVPPTEGWGSLRPITSTGDGRDSRVAETSQHSGRSSYRWEQDKQRPGQFGFGDEVGSREVAWREIPIREVSFVASMGVWDIEVEDDHSFVTQGFIVHNCREPNLQNIPTPGTELGRKIRGLFAAPPGYKEVVADYGQIEMIILAHLIGYGALYDGIMNGMDPHSATAAALAGIDPDEFMDLVKAEDKRAKVARQVAKGVNFAVVYGAGPEKVAAMAGISVKEAKRFMEIHQRMFPEIYRFKDKVLDVAKERQPPHIRTLMGRKRRLPALWSRDYGTRGYAERQAVNSLIQGTAADIIKLAMVRLHQTLEPDMKLILSVHDELVTLCPTDKADRCAEIVREAMVGEGITKLLSVPLSIDLKIVDRWSEAK